ncbi:MAG: efflux RND transporter periplasmic adaptor subunit [Pseudomonadota bacterium]|nr:efflux RND transporter periplasmic adaptor subunit [Pseudomonadota bacterium]
MNTAYVETLKTNKTILLMSATTLLFAGAAFFYSTMVHGEEESVQEAVAVVAEMTIPVAEVKAQEVNLWSRFSGRIAAVNEAEIRPQVSGRITEIRFKDGASVEKGDILMVIDPRPYEASLKEAKANLASAKSQKALAGRELKRAETLLKEDAIAQRTYDSRVNDLEVAENAILQAEAALIQAKVDVDHAYVKAPFSGQAGRAELTVGNLVQAGSAPLLTTLISNDPVYAEFDVDEQTYLKNVYSVRSNSEQKVPVRLNVKGIPQMEGSIDSFDNAINPATGTIRARALFENKDGILLPGMYAEIEMSTPTSTSELVVPKTAVATDQDRMFVYVVDEMGVAKYREVTVGRPQNGFIVIQSGLKAGEKIVTDKVGMVRSGQTINAEKVSINVEPAKEAWVAQK